MPYQSAHFSLENFSMSVLTIYKSFCNDLNFFRIQVHTQGYLQVKPFGKILYRTACVMKKVLGPKLFLEIHVDQGGLLTTQDIYNF